jgi:hypothetical protein
MINANFFWHGNSLSLYERCCLSSFVRQGIRVRLHSFSLELELPEGVLCVDASLLANVDEVVAYTQGGHQGSIAAFTDIFRYRVLAQEPGWWFDTDVFCLKSASHFAELEKQCKGLLVGLEAEGKVNGAVMYVSDTAIAHELESLANAKGLSFAWGDIGPQLVTEYEKKHPKKVTLLGQRWFYPVHYLSTKLFFLPDQRDKCMALADDAVCIHLWNEFLRRWHIPKNIMPCQDSYLSHIFQLVDPPLGLPYLPLDTFAALHAFGEVGRAGHIALKLVSMLKHFRDCLKL